MPSAIWERALLWVHKEWPASKDRLKVRCRAYKTALRAFLDEIPRAELAKELRPRIMAWTPGWLVPCRADGTFEAAV
ncbi:MAG TPA: hypothetical protein VKM72_35720 [Thermoanaerobaculia bacterium]|nr:hypothetical protein [Thermoanaerobaculia bacterium]